MGELLPVPQGCPIHLRRRPELVHRLRRWANIVYAQYGVPVYLCGSVLEDANADPRDWDVRIRISNESFTLRYGEPTTWWLEGQTGVWTRTRWRWVDDCQKQRVRAGRYTGVNIDFEIQPPMLWRRYAQAPRIRLDTRRV